MTGRDDVVRPLALLDPEDRAGVDRFRDLYVIAVEELTPGEFRSDKFDALIADALQVALRRWAEPGMPEPGLWAVVDAATSPGGPVARWVRYPRDWRNEDGASVNWCDLSGPVLIRDGVA